MSVTGTSKFSSMESSSSSKQNSYKALESSSNTKKSDEVPDIHVLSEIPYLP